MLHSEIVPEHSCHGELVELNQAPTYLHLHRYSSCGTEFTFEPDSDWVTIVLPGMKRKLVFAKSGSFTGWQCRACGWASPVSQFSGIDTDPPAEVIEAFERHDCDEIFAKAG